MDELVQLVSEKTGLDEQKSKEAVETVLSFLKEKLPAPIASQIDNVVKSGGAAQGIDNVAKGLGGILGKK
jgi:hypothetical protein